MNFVFPRFATLAIVDMAKGSGADQTTTAGRQDKKPHIAAWAVGCFVCGFSDLLHLADHRRDVRIIHFANDFNDNRTSRAQP